MRQPPSSAVRNHRFVQAVNSFLTILLRRNTDRESSSGGHKDQIRAGLVRFLLNGGAWRVASSQIGLIKEGRARSASGESEA